MATVTERLAFLISANADQAIRAFEKTANSAEKEMTKATKSIDTVAGSLTRFGARGLAATGTLAAGLFKLSQSAIDDQKAQALLAQQLRKTTQATDTQIEAVEKYIDVTARAVGVADDQLRPVFQQLVRATGNVTDSQKLLNLALDVSAGTGKDLNTVVMAISKAANGQIGALTRLGVPISENVKKTKDFDGALKELSTRFAGQAATAADTYAGRMARAKIALQETGEEIGNAFIPIIEKGSSAIGGAANAFSSLNKTSGGALGSLASYGTLALGLVSTTSLVAGQMIKMRTSFIDADGGLTRLGRTAKTASLALGALALVEGASAAIIELGGASRETERRLNTLLTTAGRGDSAQELTTAFAELADQLKNSDTGVTSFFKQFGKAIRIAGADTDAGRIAIEYLDEAFTQIAAKSPVLGQKIIDALYQQTLALDKNGATYKDNMMLIARYQQQLTGTKQATEAVTQATEDSTQKELASAEAKRKAEAAADAYAKRLRDLRGAIRDDFNTALTAAQDKLADINKTFDDYSSSVSGAVRNTLSLGKSLEEGETYMSRLRESAKKAQEFGTNIQKLLALDISKDTLDMLLEAGADTGAQFAAELVKGGQAAVDEADNLTQSVKDAGKRAGTDAATEYYNQGVNLANNLTKGINDVLSKYRLKLSSKGLSDNQLKRLQKNFKLDVEFLFTSGGFEVPELADGGIVPATRGGRLVRVAEGGRDEAIIPLPNSMRRGAEGGNIVINVNAGVGDPVAVGAAIVDVLQKYQSRTGSLPLKVR